MSWPAEQPATDRPVAQARIGGAGRAGYFMEDAREAARLADKVDADGWVRNYLSALIPAHGRILDVGCGPGVIAAAVARAWPGCSVVGVDLSEARLAVAAGNAAGLPATFQRGDACALPFSDGSFDLVYARFVLEYLPDAQLAVREMAGVCRPGGSVLLQDLDGQLLWHDPPDPLLQQLLQRAVAGHAEYGFDPLVGRRLHRLAGQASLFDLQVRIEPYHLIAGTAEPAQWQRWKLKFDIGLPALGRVIGERDAQLLADRFLDYLNRDDTLTYSVAFTVVGRRAADERL